MNYLLTLFSLLFVASVDSFLGGMACGISSDQAVPSSDSTCSPLQVNEKMSAMETAKKFDALMSEGKIEEAAAMVTDDFEFTTPMHTLTKQQWMENAEKLHKERPEFTDFEPGSNDKEVKRSGKKRMMMVNLTMKETWTFDDAGKIVSIKGAKA
ncbi:expressed unknown protein [Seminavis robusta]|uniref:Nuclear transport factor 2 family protein n=1 Tax=Seminavis robusta TaxID=568900 RepID=A0A9N8EVB3_9STRA|nr:expressed unknown protein [Seminavis robusta]|eukprot:Sro2335_g323810.1 n/a (154) ;mRNA; r:5953-6414